MINKCLILLILVVLLGIQSQFSDQHILQKPHLHSKFKSKASSPGKVSFAKAQGCTGERVVTSQIDSRRCPTRVERMTVRYSDNNFCPDVISFGPDVIRGVKIFSFTVCHSISVGAGHAVKPDW